MVRPEIALPSVKPQHNLRSRQIFSCTAVECLFNIKKCASRVLDFGFILKINEKSSVGRYNLVFW